MNTRNYTEGDLRVVKELSDHHFLCFSIEENWKLVWNSLDKKAFEIEIDVLCEKLRQCYTGRKTYLMLSDHDLKRRWYRLCYKDMQYEGNPCVLVQLVMTSEVIKDQELIALNQTRTNSIPCGIFCVHIENETMHCVYHNTYFYKMLGYDESELDQDDMLTTKIIYSEDYDKFRMEISHNIKIKSELFELEYRVMRKDGTMLWVLARVVPDLLENHYLAIVLDNTLRREIVNQLRINEEEKRIALQQGNLTILRYDVKQKTLYITDEGMYTGEQHKIINDFPDAVIDASIVSEETKKEFMEFYHHMQEGKPQGSAVFKQMIFPKQEFCWIKARYTMIYDEANEPQTAIISYEDYTEFHEKEMVYEKWRVEFDRKKDETIAYYEYDLTHDKFEALEGKLSDSLPQAVRKSFTYIAHYAANHLVSPQDHKKYLKIFSREYLLAQYAKGKQIITLKHRRLREDGTEFWSLAEIRMVLEPYTSTLKASVLLYDIDEKVKQDIKLRKLSQTDSLTGLYNRNSLFQRMETTLAHSGTQVMHMMILIDIDHFKELNDTYGHQYGDECLVSVAHAMQSITRGEDLCSRIGGDEFVIFMRNLPQNSDVRHKLEELKAAITSVDHYGRSMSASIGAACYPKDGMDITTLYHNADEAMYEAKNQGRNRYCIFCQKK